MFKINIICIGKIKEKYIKSGIDEYLKRLSRFAKVNIIELSEEQIPKNASQNQINLIKQKESKKLQDAIKSGTYTICLTPNAKQLNSTEFSNMISNISLNNSELNFIIGRSYGLDDVILKNSNFNMSFSDLTFPHQLFRLIFLEQLFRAFKIANNETYDK